MRPLNWATILTRCISEEHTTAYEPWLIVLTTPSTLSMSRLTSMLAIDALKLVADWLAANHHPEPVLSKLALRDKSPTDRLAIGDG